ncbi:hypothetical protein B0F90DRAFT_1593472, partial [Multifurca ochricompacta]
MGGKAFASHLPNATFPRLDPTLYTSLKSSLLPHLTPLFHHVAVPREAPQKQDYGDIDFVVACPRAAIGHEEIKQALGASACIPSTQPGGRGTHNFALRLADFVPPQSADANLASVETCEIHVQVDVNVRKDEQDWENVMFFHAYGDLGMLIGRLAASVGLHLGELGLKMTSQALSPTYSSTFPLSSSMPDILSFLELSLERWRAGFATEHEAFEWVASSRFYTPGQVSDTASRAKSRSNRSMYHAFFNWSDAKMEVTAETNGLPQVTQEVSSKEAVKQAVRQEALVFFCKKEEHDALVRENEKRVRFKAIWNGKKVGEWTGWTGWLVGRVMNLMRQTVGEE